jgi:hypothetical protein
MNTMQGKQSPKQVERQYTPEKRRHSPPFNERVPKRTFMIRLGNALIATNNFWRKGKIGAFAYAVKSAR